MTTYTHNETVFVDQGRIEFYIKDIDVTIICPNVRRTSGKGAGYVKNWTVLTHDLMKILVTWNNESIMRGNPYEKKLLRKWLATRGCVINEDPMNARVSELLGLGLVSMNRDQGKPQYKLMLDKVSTVLNNSGRLKWNTWRT